MLMLALLFRWDASAAQVPIRDGGINPANLGKGDWIWHVSWATNKLGGVAPSVVNFPTLMSYYKSQGLHYTIVKAGTGSTNFFGDKHSAPQFNSNLVYHAHAAGMLIFAYTRSYDDDVQGEIDMAARCFAVGADGWVIDAESEWESGASQAGTNGPTRAIRYGEGPPRAVPNKFIAHAPFPIISFHSSFPYKEFGYFCDSVMPQAYWTEIYDDDPKPLQHVHCDGQRISQLAELAHRCLDQRHQADCAHRAGVEFDQRGDDWRRHRRVLRPLPDERESCERDRLQRHQLLACRSEDRRHVGCESTRTSWEMCRARKPHDATAEPDRGNRHERHFHRLGTGSKPSIIDGGSMARAFRERLRPILR